MTKPKPPGTHLPRGPRPKTDPCRIDDCGERGAVRGLCHPHYEKWRREEWREKRAEQWRAWRDRNLADPERAAQMAERRADALARYREARKEEVRQSSLAYQRRRRAWRLSAPSEPYTDKLVLATYGTICHLCGEEINLDAPRLSRDGAGWERGLHLDHVIPLSRGGPDLLENLRPAHALCNISKGLTAFPEAVVSR